MLDKIRYFAINAVKGKSLTAFAFFNEFKKKNFNCKFLPHQIQKEKKP